MDEWVKKMCYAYPMDYDSGMKRNEILPFVTIWMNHESVTLSEISQRKKTNTIQIPYDLAC